MQLVLGGLGGRGAKRRARSCSAGKSEWYSVLLGEERSPGQLCRARARKDGASPMALCVFVASTLAQRVSGIRGRDVSLRFGFAWVGRSMGIRCGGPC